MKVFVAVPVHGHIDPEFLSSMMWLTAGLQDDYDFIFSVKWPVSNLARERCLLLRAALDSDAEKLLFIDDDIYFAPSDAKQIIEAEGDVVAANYRKKKATIEHVGYPRSMLGSPEERNGPLRSMGCVGFGLTCIDLEFLRKALVKAKPCIEHFSAPGFEKAIPSLFEFKTTQDLMGQTRFLGEDETFCKYVIEAGGKVWLHEGVTVGHVGSFVYR